VGVFCDCKRPPLRARPPPSVVPAHASHACNVQAGVVAVAVARVPSSCACACHLRVRMLVCVLCGVFFSLFIVRPAGGDAVVDLLSVTEFVELLGRLALRFTPPAPPSALDTLGPEASPVRSVQQVRVACACGAVCVAAHCRRVVGVCPFPALCCCAALRCWAAALCCVTVLGGCAPCRALCARRGRQLLFELETSRGRDKVARTARGAGAIPAFRGIKKLLDRSRGVA
jgi:hypothetical protein